MDIKCKLYWQFRRHGKSLTKQVYWDYLWGSSGTESFSSSSIWSENMAMVLDAFMERYMNKLGDFIEEKAVAVLGMKDDLKRLQRRLEMIHGVLEDAERKRIDDKAINSWVKELKDIMYEADDIIDLCQIKGQKGGRSYEDEPSTSSTSSSGWSVITFFPSISNLSNAASNYGLDNRIKSLINRLKEVTEDRLILSRLEYRKQEVLAGGVNSRQTSPLPKSYIVGRQTEEAAKRLVESMVKVEEQNLLVFGIVGMGGIGKTTLAQKIYNDPRLEANFHSKIWLCVSQNFSETELLKQMIRGAGGSHGQAETKAELQPLLTSLLSGKRLFLVLDDVWRADVWEDLLQAPLEQGRSSSRILITTRHEDVAMSMRAVNTHRVSKMPTYDGWALLCNNVFWTNDEEDIQNLKVIGMKIVRKCRGLPLAVKAVAGVLRTKGRNKVEWGNVYKSQAWFLRGKLPEEVRGALYLSYDYLPSHLKQCFLYCSLYPEDSKLYRCDLVRHWVAEGFVVVQGDSSLEDTAEGYYNELMRRSLLEPDPVSLDNTFCKMHDLVRSLVQSLAQDESCLVDARVTRATSVKLRRLSIAYRGEMTLVLDAIKDPECLRTLIVFKSPPIKEVKKDIIQQLTHLRVLDLSGTLIESLPDSVKDLIHLRLLDLNCTRISELPESLGCLTNLQFLCLASCEFLRTVPESITQLCNLRHLGIAETPLSHVPRGIGKLKYLISLTGFVVGDDGKQERGCDLEELQSLSNLRTLRIDKLERTQSGGTFVLRNKPNLRDLALSCSVHAVNSDLEETRRIEKIYEDLSPPPTLEILGIYNFFGLKYPGWLAASRSSCSNLSCLTQLYLMDCMLCEQLPPLGQLSQLTFLVIHGASAMVTIGREFFGSGTRKQPHGAAMTSFPKLQFLRFSNMPNWEEWSFEGELADGGSQTDLQLLPHLQILELVDCPKLRSLPEGLQHVTTLQNCYVKGAHSLLEIENFSTLTHLHIDNNICLERLSNFPSLSDLRIRDCPALRYAEKIDMLQWLWLEDDSMSSLPEWLFKLFQQQKQQLGAHSPLQELHLRCNDGLHQKCIEEGEYRPLLEHIPYLSVRLYQQ